MKRLLAGSLACATLMLMPIQASAHRVPVPTITRAVVDCQAGLVHLFASKWTGFGVVTQAGHPVPDLQTYNDHWAMALFYTLRHGHPTTIPISDTPARGEATLSLWIIGRMNQGSNQTFGDGPYGANGTYVIQRWHGVNLQSPFEPFAGLHTFHVDCA